MSISDPFFDFIADVAAPHPTHRQEVATQESRGIHQVTAMREHEVTPPVGLGIARGPPGLLALERDWLQVIGHRVAKRRIVVPGFECDQAANFIADEAMRKRDAGIENVASRGLLIPESAMVVSVTIPRPFRIAVTPADTASADMYIVLTYSKSAVV